MSDSLVVGGTTYTGVTGFKATDTSENTLTYVRPQGNKSITANGTGIDVAEYATVSVAVPAPSPSLQSKTNIDPIESSQTIQADSGYDGLSSVQINAISSSYVGSGVARKSSTDLTASGATVTAPAGYYAEEASKSVSSGSATTPATTITANPSISVSSGGLITATASATQSVTPTVSAGYVSSGTAGTITVSGSNTSQLTVQAAQTIHPSTSDQTISSGKYLTGAQTVKGVLLTNLSAGNIKKDVTIKIGDSTDDDCVTSVTGTFEGGITPSGSITITTNTTTDVTNYATAVTNIPNAYTLTDVSNTTGTTAQITAGSGGGGGGATQHEIHLEFTDSTDTDINVYYDDSLIGTMITAYGPATWTYGNKTVDSAALDNVTWYQRQTETWETIYNGNSVQFNPETNSYSYCWIPALSTVSITVGSVWRVTYDGVAYRLTATTQSGYGFLGNPKYVGGIDDGSGVPFDLIDYTQYGAWTGNDNSYNASSATYHDIKIERLVTS